MNIKSKKPEANTFEKPAMSLDKIAEADTVIGKPIITVSGTQVIPLSSVTVVNMGGGGEYGDIKTFRQADGFKVAGGNGTVVTVKPMGFLVDDGKGCTLMKMTEDAIEKLIDKTSALVNKLSGDD